MSFKAAPGKLEKNAPPVPKRASPSSMKGGAAHPGKRHMEIEETDNGGFISKTTHLKPRGEDHSYRPNPVTTAQHGSVRALQSHIRKTFPPKSKPSTPAMPTEAGSIASKMLGGSNYC